jgi:hypothetical protein
MKKRIFFVMFLLISAFATAQRSQMCCDMEDAMEECWAVQDYVGFNTILADWMANC